ncbi:NACHT domain-containing protein [Amycolatopsis sp. OK19-0408]|uniref:NACHT domain-containing protein n=1 Tax=Amycolatopsis iheyensis TaxID=2945988 RepID=A0A9X2NLH5_9PSEU|nr:NACHT domain-containing protein [Amycolatopsis iheyensis]MCR6489603.1 NACHT domain-containing protein [Amycolatopsis iheyensis]
MLEGEKAIDHDQEAALLAGALLRRWKPELEHRAGRGDGRIIPLTWRQRSDAVAAPAAEVVGTDLPVNIRLNGVLGGNVDQAATSLAEGFEGVPNHRLVLLGEPGSGKTFLALALAVGLLRSRVAGGRVPVLLSLASWDPVAQSLDTWLTRSLAEENFTGDERIPQALLAAGLILPVLDGLDELPEHVRRRAVSRINDTLRGPRPVVLTCRSADYTDVLAAGAPVVLRAPVVQVEPLSPRGIAHHLRTTDQCPSAWSAVIDHVQANAAGPLTSALSTPLMLSIFVAGFRTADPGPLLHDPELDNRLSLEDRLVDVLADSLGETERKPAREWLTFMAEQLHGRGERNFSWWHLGGWAPPICQWILAPFLALWFGGGVAMASAGLSNADSDFSFLSDLPGFPVIFGVWAGVLLLGTSVSENNQEVSVARDPGVVRRRLKQIFSRDSSENVSAVILLAVTVSLVLDAKSQLLVVCGTAAGVIVGVGVVIRIGMEIHRYWTARGHRIAVTTPRELLRHERTSSLIAAAMVAVVVALGAVPAATWGGVVGRHVGQQLAQWRGKPVVLDRSFFGGPSHLPWVVDRAHLPSLAWVSFVIGLLAGACVLFARPWARFGFARVNLAVSRRLPLNLMRFLDQAHEHGLLRVSGGSYQFRHIRMQERLVITARPAVSRRAWRKKLSAVTAGVLFVGAIAAIVVVGAAQPPSCPDSGIAELDRVAAGPASACLGFVENPGLLGLPSLNTGPIKLVVGEFDRMSPQERGKVADQARELGGDLRFIELSDPLPSADVVPTLLPELLNTIDGAFGPYRRYHATVHNGVVEITEW